MFAVLAQAQLKYTSKQIAYIVYQKNMKQFFFP